MDSLTTETYQFPYQPLNSAINEIRLLVVFPSQHEIVCDLYTASLDSPVQYRALSYVWGDSKEKREICIKGDTLAVTLNLHAGLLQLSRDADEPFLIWADAVCINQADERERNSQVQLMGDSYRRAESVIVWLGSEEDKSDIVMATFARLSELYDKSIDPHTFPRNDAEFAHVRALLEPLPTTCLKGDFHGWCYELLHRRWWERVWTYQEFVLAEDITIMCGTKALKWDSFRSATAVLDLKARTTPKKHTLAWQDTALRNQYLDMESFQERRDYHSSSTKSRTPLLYESIEHIRMDNRECSDPRDYVFALLGLANDEIAQQLSVDYGQDVVEVFSDVAEIALKSRLPLTYCLSFCQIDMDEQQLSELHAVTSSISTENRIYGGAGFQQPPTLDTSEFPTWVPRWHRQLPKRRLRHSYYYASKSFPLVSGGAVFQDDRSRSVTLPGATVDRVHKLGPWMLGKDKLTDWFRDVLALIETCTAYSSDDEKGEALWRTLCSDIMYHQYDPQSRFIYRARSSDFESFAEFGRWSQHPVSEFPDSALAMSFLSSFTTRGNERRVYITENGYFCHGPPSIKVDDIVCILCNANVPNLLRKRDDGKYLLVGDTYVHNIMDGEFQPVRSDIKRFTLV